MGDHVLGDENNAQLVEYLRFLRRKRDSAIAEVAADFKDVRESRLFEETYSVEEVEAILDGLLGVVRSTMKRDLQATSFSSVLLLKQCFEQAERASTSLSTNVPATEDMGLLRAVEDWDQNVHGSSGAAPPLRARAAMDARPSSSRALPLIGQTQDPKLLADLQNTRDDNASLQERPALYHLALALAFALSLRRIPQPHPIPFSLDLDLSPIPAVTLMQSRSPLPSPSRRLAAGALPATAGAVLGSAAREDGDAVADRGDDAGGRRALGRLRGGRHASRAGRAAPGGTRGRK